MTVPKQNCEFLPSYGDVRKIIKTLPGESTYKLFFNFRDQYSSGNY